MTDTIIGKRRFGGGTHIMGILNVTPDSFSDGGKYSDIDAALYRANQMISEGAEIIDIGGESTRPGSVPVSCAEEIERVLPVLTALRSRFDIPLCVDTYKSAVVSAVLEAGADMINDIRGFLFDPETARLVATHKAACCLMHFAEKPCAGDAVSAVVKGLEKSVAAAKAAGISDDKIIIDGGVGFGKTVAQNLAVIKAAASLMPYPTLMAVSRKSVIGAVLNAPVDERLEGTLAVTAYAALCGCRFVRVHDIAENKRVLAMLEAIERGENYA